MMDIGPLFHWSPRDRLDRIKRLGLMPGQAGVHAVEVQERIDRLKVVTEDEDGDHIESALAEWRAGWVCASLDPATAWNYSHGAWRSVGTFDLWQFWLEPTDEVHINPMWGGQIIEVRVHNRIRKGRLTWVGERVGQ